MDDDELCGLSCQTEPERLSHRAATGASRSLAQRQRRVNRKVSSVRQLSETKCGGLSLPDRADGDSGAIWLTGS
jgi:hypothetical protein